MRTEAQFCHKHRTNGQGIRGWGGVEGGRGEPGIYAKKEAGKLPREEGSDCIFEAGSPGANPWKRRPRGAGESVDPLELSAPDEPMPCPQYRASGLSI